MSEIDNELFAVKQEIDNLKLAIRFVADADRMTLLYERLNQRYAEYVRLSQQRFDDITEEYGLERSVGEE